MVVRRDLRGQGVGRAIMAGCEAFVRSAGLARVYLSTPDQQGFYARLGYAECARPAFAKVIAGRANPAELLGRADVPAAAATEDEDAVAGSASAAPPPPPPPALSLSPPAEAATTWMLKTLI